MNEQFQKLLKEATYDVLGVKQVDQKQFAKLIINECIKVVHQQDRIPKEFFYPKGADIHELAIKQHFGIQDEQN